MSAPVPVRVASVILVGAGRRFLLQQRDDIPGIVHPGLLGLFGGHCEAGESALECAQREIEEEVGLALPLDRFDLLMHSLTTLPNGPGLDLSVYVVEGATVDGLSVTEGQGVVLSLDEVQQTYGRMTPSGALALRFYCTSRLGRSASGLPERQEQAQPKANGEPTDGGQQQ